MKKFKEFKMKFKRSFWLSIFYFTISILVILMTSLILITGNLFVKGEESHKKINQLSDGYRVYTLIDTLLDDDFFNFRSDRQKMNRIVDFYNHLNESKDMHLLSGFYQPLYVQEFKGEDKFLYSQEMNGLQDSSVAIKSFQLNHKMFDYFKLKLQNDYSVKWNLLDFSSNGSYPLILGSNYKNIYQIGDRISAEYYTKEIIFEVVGFLETNSFVYYKGQAEFYLDDYMIIPYPERLSEITKEEFSFESILYFAMLNSQIATKHPTTELLKKLNHIAQNANFFDYSIIEVDDYLLKYGQLNSVIKHYRKLLLTLIIVLTIILYYAVYSMTKFILAQYKDLIYVHRLLGSRLKEKLLKNTFILMFIISLLLGLLIELLIFGKIQFLPIILFVNVCVYFVLYKLILFKNEWNMRGGSND